MFRCLILGVLQHHVQAEPAPDAGDFLGGFPGGGQFHRQSTAEAVGPDRTRDAALPSPFLDSVGNSGFAEPALRDPAVGDGSEQRSVINPGEFVQRRSLRAAMGPILATAPFPAWSVFDRRIRMVRPSPRSASRTSSTFSPWASEQRSAPSNITWNRAASRTPYRDSSRSQCVHRVSKSASLSPFAFPRPRPAASGPDV